MNPAISRRRTLVAILALGFILRAGLGVFYPGIAHPDEVFQYQEPAHHLLTGFGVPSWEWVGHVRSWFVPALVLPAMAGIRLFTTSPEAYWNMMAVLVSAASLGVIWVAFRWGEDEGGLRGGIIAGAIAALAFQLVYFSSHLLLDTVATDLLLPALYAARRYRLGGSAKGALGPAVSLIVLIAYLRPQLGPALLLPGIATLVVARRRGDALFMVGVGFAVLFALGLLDWVTLGKPFQSVWLYAYINLFQVADDFGTSPAYWYLKNMATVWIVATIPIIWFVGIAARRYKIELGTALLIVAAMSAIGHKEPRFILPAETILLILTGVGIAIATRGRAGFWARPAPIVLLTALLSLGLALAHPFRPVIEQGHTELMVVDRLMQNPRICGIYFLPRTSLLNYAGYTGSRDGIRLVSDRFDTPAANLLHANAILTRMKRGVTFPAPSGFARQSCKSTTSGYDVCVYVRPGTCR